MKQLLFALAFLVLIQVSPNAKIMAMAADTPEERQRYLGFLKLDPITNAPWVIRSELKRYASQFEEKNDLPPTPQDVLKEAKRRSFGAIKQVENAHPQQTFTHRLRRALSDKLSPASKNVLPSRYVNPETALLGAINWTKYYSDLDIALNNETPRKQRIVHEVQQLEQYVRQTNDPFSTKQQGPLAKFTKTQPRRLEFGPTHPATFATAPSTSTTTTTTSTASVGQENVNPNGSPVLTPPSSPSTGKRKLETITTPKKIQRPRSKPAGFGKSPKKKKQATLGQFFE